MAKTAEEVIAEVRAIGERVNAMRLAAPADDPLQSAAFKTVLLCGKIEAAIRASVTSTPPEQFQKRATERRSSPLEE